MTETARRGDKVVIADGRERACINCVWYEQFFRRNRGNLYGWTATPKGYCIRRNQYRDALRGACGSFQPEQQEVKEGTQ